MLFLFKEMDTLAALVSLLDFKLAPKPGCSMEYGMLHLVLTVICFICGFQSDISNLIMPTLSHILLSTVG